MHGARRRGRIDGPFDASTNDATLSDGAPSDDAQSDRAVPEEASTTITCTSSLASVCDFDAGPGSGADWTCPPSSASALPGPWCAQNPRAGQVYGACGGYLALPLGVGTDGELIFMYDAASGALVAVLSSGDLQRPVCMGGDSNFQISDTVCFPDQGFDFNAFSGPGGSAACVAYDAGPSAMDAGDASD